ncbi:NYN domain-containing protein [Rhodomicrobium vannielii ATCC 17100]|uniref:NYN domain-containing protein n=1 Tax=Rhodomicrobium vannielii TaxID=1069 RepID=UPI001919BE2D|nr:NYN domain-containing protein [Rhodomicrobium vannielii]MBJ7533774.1 NYN domain-containing protein [Rhodomicrobium vannielii ATCC 17100]
MTKSKKPNGDKGSSHHTKANGSPAYRDDTGKTATNRTTLTLSGTKTNITPINAEGAPEAAIRLGSNGHILKEDTSGEPAEVAASLKKIRALFVVDGFNLYSGINDTKIPHLKWLDLRALAESVIGPQEEIVKIRWCSAIAENPDKAARHGVYEKALRSRGVEISLGHWATEKVECRVKCGAKESDRTFERRVEKGGDVNLAIHAVLDHQHYDKCYFVTGDSDQVPTIEMVMRTLKKRAAVVFPPNRFSKHLYDISSERISLTLETIQKCRLPEEILQDGFKPIICPDVYKIPKNYRLPNTENQKTPTKPQQRAFVVEHKKRRLPVKSI